MNQASPVTHPSIAVYNYFALMFERGRSVATSEAVKAIASNTYTKHNIECAISKLKKKGVLENIHGSGTRGDPYFVGLVAGALAPVLNKPYTPFKRRTKEELAHDLYMSEKAKKEANSTAKQIPATTNNSLASEFARLNLKANQTPVVVKEALPMGLAIIPRSKLPGISAKETGLAVVWRGQETSFEELRKIREQLNAFFG